MRDKVLVVLEERGAQNTRWLTDVFGDGITGETPIYSDLTWTTKYYSETFDLYVDEYDDLDEWIEEFTSDDCAVLRDALAGVILVRTGIATGDHHSQRIANSLSTDDMFLVWLDKRESVDDRELPLPWEVVQLEETARDRELNEKSGAARLKEILDVHTWPGTDRLEQEPADMDELITLMREARLRCQDMSDDEESQRYAMSLAEQIAKRI
ncbi:Irc6p KNAG_0D02900 [Huiozyma naganishii CBS 8797]|uniref:Increased recombination centers protein 6 n=1 Tax=Huiozyma naganishii (strain ATCC MYA-139 / BCRC 22969 / CBS 8797 / KCTC 17520 / NBRC 10181 / NCYC 3082 / Yp74L-3) TaxID=1071383 RepID=J7S5W1_HUIN7|nr:hypothetical protein KNAG_0D02900 [Kazachstania naganishii CBS 8797]CCK70039.1 hypothetical protein KNAG_0D02900 [Kazachstania naganishii CBS 8797]